MLAAKQLVVQAAQRPPDTEGHHGNGHCSCNFRRQGPAQLLRAFGQVSNQPGDVVGDGRHRQPLHRGLQLQLHALAVVHGGQNFLVALLLFNLYPRAQQVAALRSCILNNLTELKEGKYQPAWNEVNPSGTVGNMTKFK